MRTFAKTIAGILLGLALSSGVVWLNESDASLKAVSPGVNGGGTVTSSQLLVPDGSASTPSVAPASSPTTGIYKYDASGLGVSSGGNASLYLGNLLSLSSGIALQWTNSASNPNTTVSVTLVRDADNTLAQKNGSSAQVRRAYATTTGPVYWQETARTNGALYTGSGGSAQVSYAQTTAPTCSSNCGTSPSVSGTDTAGIVTMGSSGVPASGFVITFNGTWPAAPACVVQMYLAGMVVGKMPLTVATTTTTLTVVTNGTAPATSDKYVYHCFGVS